MSKTSLLYCLLFWMIAAAAIADSPTPVSRADFLEQLTAGVVEINPTELRSALENQSGRIVILDVRTTYERVRTQTILGQREIHIPRGFLEVKAWDQLPRDARIVVYCSKGMRSKLAAVTLEAMGWQDVSSLEGGIEAWFAQGGEDCGCLPEDQEIPGQDTPFECPVGEGQSQSR